MAFIVVGTGLFFVIVFHCGVKEPQRDSTYEFATKGSKRSPSNWTKWFREVQFYQVRKYLINQKLCYCCRSEVSLSDPVVTAMLMNENL